jgi:iron complex outermembrane receptor protein
MTLPYRYPFASFLLLAALNAAAQSANPDEEELALAYGDKTTTSIATGSQQMLARAPSTATVITAQDIAAMGATDLDQVLESVPGLHVSVSHIVYNPIYSFRGIFSNYNPQVLMLVNGQPITALFAGHRSFAWGGMPLENVERIEIIRGPGSAMYGADAYSGVINVVTKSADQVGGMQYGVRIGSFDTRDAFVQWGGQLGGIKTALYLRAGHTDGDRSVIDKDLQTLLDGLFGTKASLAPGPVNNVRDMLDARADFELGDWRLRLALQDRDIGMGAGLAESLDPWSRSPERRIYADLAYSKAGFAPNWDLAANIGAYQLKEEPGDPAYLLFPAGAFGGAFPDGVIGNPGHYERHFYLSASASYTGFDRHRLRIGSGYRVDDLYGTPEYKNFSIVAMPNVGPVFIPLGSLVDASKDPTLWYAHPHMRKLHYAFVQDEWAMAKDWNLTAGIRWDDYSDFGSTINPRLAMVWDAAYNVIVKAMHGRAFRAPAFVEQYNRNNPVNVGNPSIQPETIAMSELALAWQPSAAVQANFSLFRYRMDDVIILAANSDPATGKTYRNAGAQKGHGLEVELTWDASRALRFSGSYSFQSSTESKSGKPAGLAPRHRIYGRADWRFAPAWQFGATVNHVAGRLREPGDPRPPVRDFSTVDLTMRRERIGNGWEVRAGVSNLFNADVREPSFAPGNIPNDLPMPKRAFNVQLVHRL